MAVAAPDLELRGGPGLDLLAMAAIFLSVISSFFTQNKGGTRAPRDPPLDPPLCGATLLVGAWQREKQQNELVE